MCSATTNRQTTCGALFRQIVGRGCRHALLLAVGRAGHGSLLRIGSSNEPTAVPPQDRALTRLGNAGSRIASSPGDGASTSEGRRRQHLRPLGPSDQAAVGPRQDVFHGDECDDGSLVAGDGGEMVPLVRIAVRVSSTGVSICARLTGCSAVRAKACAARAHHFRGESERCSWLRYGPPQSAPPAVGRVSVGTPPAVDVSQARQVRLRQPRLHHCLRTSGTSSTSILPASDPQSNVSRASSASAWPWQTGR
jgi:hypothetical protein